MHQIGRPCGDRGGEPHQGSQLAEGNNFSTGITLAITTHSNPTVTAQVTTVATAEP